ncbi:phosphotransferase enzyme family protein [Histoplasma capsulatum G186AR]|uniref:Altered inheritance of mitochondria protein 9, mitochondrial n=1 Tax=Ajellomyces capsulatus TaxID=5037 RepID=A0A8H7YQY4_AJECA|nr:phosphotransferase enzyme family protein [Histoplasma capsulatum]QSS75574.1 phosphotransferase enzyme family protein [Histoplasma capsulatum G186AR]
MCSTSHMSTDCRFHSLCNKSWHQQPVATMRLFDGLVECFNTLLLHMKNRITSAATGSRSMSGLIKASQKTLFCYTSGRWLYDERRQLSRRYVKFNVEGLCRTASDIVGAPCTQVTKLPEGLYNKVFSLKTDTGEELLARIPNPNAGSAREVIASEVATLDFLRNVLGIPVPEVVAWSSPSVPNLVGTGYILMKRIIGHQLSDVWNDMSQAQRFGLVRSLVAIEAKLVKTEMPGYGSLYYRDDYPDGMSMDDVLSPAGSTANRFVLGPSTDRPFWVDGRGALDLDRGPWASASEYFSAIAKREMECIRTAAQNEPSLMDFGGKDTAREIHINLLNQFLAILPYILPSQYFCSPTLLHQDLHLENIFVDSADPTKISGIIDWQSTYSAPLFMQARFPSVFD